MSELLRAELHGPKRKVMYSLYLTEDSQRLTVSNASTLFRLQSLNGAWELVFPGSSFCYYPSAQTSNLITYEEAQAHLLLPRPLAYSCTTEARAFVTARHSTTKFVFQGWTLFRPLHLSCHYHLMLCRHFFRTLLTFFYLGFLTQILIRQSKSGCQFQGQQQYSLMWMWVV